MTSADFKLALHEAGFGVDHGRIVDVSGKCPGFATLPSFNNGVVKPQCHSIEGDLGA
jgi:hypothetical protein